MQFSDRSLVLQDFSSNLKNGFAFNLPVIVLGAIAGVWLGRDAGPLGQIGTLVIQLVSCSPSRCSCSPFSTRS